jgi:hypothetical protein
VSQAGAVSPVNTGEMGASRANDGYECETARQREALHEFRNDLRYREREPSRKSAESAYGRKAFFPSEIRSFVLSLALCSRPYLPCRR